MIKRGNKNDIAKSKSLICAHLGGIESIDFIYQGATENQVSVYDSLMDLCSQGIIINNLRGYNE